MEYPLIEGYCSMFQGVGERVFLNLYIHQILLLVKNGNLNPTIGLLRQYKETDIDRFHIEKCGLLAFTPAGYFHPIRKHEFIQSLSGIVVLDFDHLDNVQLYKRKVIEQPYTLGCFISPSGEGLKILVRANPKSDYIGSYYAAARYYRKIIKQGFDEAYDVTRLCFLSHDPELFWNQNAHFIKVKTTKVSHYELTKHL